MIRHMTVLDTHADVYVLPLHTVSLHTHAGRAETTSLNNMISWIGVRKKASKLILMTDGEDQRPMLQSLHSLCS